jgi:glucan 1,3-beta-glucosidase
MVILFVSAVAAQGVYGNIVPQITCGQASSARTSFPVFVGEWSLEAIYNNTLAGRAALYQSQQYAYATYLSGSAFWSYNSVVDTTTPVDGEGSKVDYWNFQKIAAAGGIILPNGAINASYC